MRGAEGFGRGVPQAESAAGAEGCNGSRAGAPWVLRGAEECRASRRLRSAPGPSTRRLTLTLTLTLNPTLTPTLTRTWSECTSLKVCTHCRVCTSQTLTLWSLEQETTWFGLGSGLGLGSGFGFGLELDLRVVR